MSYLGTVRKVSSKSEKNKLINLTNSNAMKVKYERQFLIIDKPRAIAQKANTERVWE